MVNDTTIVGWDDISTAEGWDEYATFLLENKFVNDYKVIRTEIKNYIYSIINDDWNN